MKKTFDKYVKKVCEYYGITKKELFSKGKNPIKSDARYLLYYMCVRSGMRNYQVVHFVNSSGYKILKSDVSRGVSKWSDRVVYDADFLESVKNLEK